MSISIPESVKEFAMVVAGLRIIDENIKVDGKTIGDMENLLGDMAKLDQAAVVNVAEGGAIQGKRQDLSETFRDLSKKSRHKIKSDYGDNAKELRLIGAVPADDIVRTRRPKSEEDTTDPSAPSSAPAPSP